MKTAQPSREELNQHRKDVKTLHKCANFHHQKSKASLEKIVKRIRLFQTKYGYMYS